MCTRDLGLASKGLTPYWGDCSTTGFHPLELAAVDMVVGSPETLTSVLKLPALLLTAKGRMKIFLTLLDSWSQTRQALGSFRELLQYIFFLIDESRGINSR